MSVTTLSILSIIEGFFGGSPGTKSESSQPGPVCLALVCSSHAARGAISCALKCKIFEREQIVPIRSVCRITPTLCKSLKMSIYNEKEETGVSGAGVFMMCSRQLDLILKYESRTEKALEVFQNGSETMCRDANRAQRRLSSQYCSCSVAGNGSGHAQCVERGY